MKEMQNDAMLKEAPAPTKRQGVSLGEAEAFIHGNLKSAARSVIAIGYYLKCVKQEELFKEAGFRDIYDYAKERFGFSSSTTSRYMTRNDKFSVNGNSPLLDEKYKDFNKSQMQEMLGLDMEQLEQVTPDMTVVQIREMKKPKEMPYVHMPGQIELTDFPGVEPADASAALKAREAMAAGQPEKQTYTISAAELLPDPPMEHRAAIAISQQKVEDAAPETRNNVPETVSDGKFTGDEEQEKDGPKQPDLPVLKNNDQRAAFVDAYETWPLWIETVQTGERYYRYDLEDGTSMVVKVYLAMLFERVEGSYKGRYSEGYGRNEYYLLQPEKFFRDCEANRSALIDKLKEIQRVKKGSRGDEHKADG